MTTTIKRFFVALQLVLCVFTTPAAKKVNILFIAVDDLKPEMGCYGNTLIKTPNMDKLSESGTTFMQTYCQQAVCGPTRASLLTGMRPDYTRVWDLKTKMRDINPEIISIPQYFRMQGYETAGIGKIFDSRCVDEELDKPSWSIPYYKRPDDYFSTSTGKPEGQYQNPETKSLVRKYTEEGQQKGLKGKDLNDFVGTKIKPSAECLDVPDNAYQDGANTRYARDILAKLAESDKPFFFAVGLTKPHLPFVAPKKYWDLYDTKKMPLAPFQKQAKNSPGMAYHNAAELYSYSDIPPISSFSDQKVGLDLPVDKQKELIHGYYAATSYTDSNVGILLKTLDSLGIRENTIVILWGDHGWHLGDHNLWVQTHQFRTGHTCSAYHFSARNCPFKILISFRICRHLSYPLRIGRNPGANTPRREKSCSGYEKPRVRNKKICRQSISTDP